MKKSRVKRNLFQLPTTYEEATYNPMERSYCVGHNESWLIGMRMFVADEHCLSEDEKRRLNEFYEKMKQNLFDLTSEFEKRRVQERKIIQTSDSPITPGDIADTLISPIKTTHRREKKRTKIYHKKYESSI
jgi:hypothetical protein